MSFRIGAMGGKICSQVVNLMSQTPDRNRMSARLRSQGIELGCGGITLGSYGIELGRGGITLGSYGIELVTADEVWTHPAPINGPT